ncbi:MAG: hypothetical protein AAF628_33785 [Planctomycetota bacterium]
MSTLVPHHHAFASLAAIGLVLGGATAQDAGTTLAALVDRAAVVAVASTEGVALPTPQLAVRFQIQQTLRGAGPGNVVLREEGGRCCGRALHGLSGGQFVMFLEQRAGAWHLVAGPRSLVPARTDVVAHVRALVATRSDAARLRVVAEGLEARDQRVRRDAALTLPYAAGLEGAEPRVRGAVVAALQRSLSGEGHDESMHLVLSAARLRLDEALPALLSAYLEPRDRTLDGVLLRELPRFDQARIARALATLPGDPARAVRLLATLDTPAADAPLRRAVRTAPTSTAALAAATLIRRHGADAAGLTRQLDRDGRTALRAMLAERRRQFRAIAPGGQR